MMVVQKVELMAVVRVASMDGLRVGEKAEKKVAKSVV